MQKSSKKKTILTIIGIVVLVLSVAYAWTNHYYSQLNINREVINEPVINNNDQENPTQPLTPKEDPITTFLLVGTDESGYLTDSMLAVRIDFENKTTSLFSVPRDYMVELSDKVQGDINYYSRYIKLTELHSYAKSAEYSSPISLTTKAIEELLGFEFDHIVLFSIDAFKNVVDAVGGVEVYVPVAMNYYDPVQNLRINLQPGQQLLDGELAEGFVRYRKDNYNNGYGDFGRMEMQQYFLKEFVKKLLSVESLLNFNEVFESIKDFVQTDASLNDALFLVSKVKDLDFDRIYSHTLPGKNRIINGKYFLAPPDINELHSLVKEMIAIDNGDVATSKEYDIVVLNGTDKLKMASKYREILLEEGYNVVSIGDYYGDKAIKTQIVVPDDSLGQDLKQLFDFSEIIVDTTAENITIILGRIEE